MDILQQLNAFEIPDVYFFTVESLILLYVYLDYKKDKRKPGRPKKTKIHRFMESLSKTFHIREKARR